MNEDPLAQETLGWLADVGYQHRYGPELAPDGSTPERRDYRQVLLTGRLRQAIAAPTNCKPWCVACWRRSTCWTACASSFSLKTNLATAADWSCGIEDLQSISVLESRKCLGEGELSSIAFAMKIRLAVITDDRKALELAVEAGHALARRRHRICSLG